MESGRRAVLAHPEKNLAIQRAPEYVYKLLALFKPWEVLIQLTADSLSGAAGFQALTCSKTLLKHNLAHLIASDADSAEGRVPCLSSAVKNAARIVGEDNALKMVQHIPQRSSWLRLSRKSGHRAIPDDGGEYSEPRRNRFSMRTASRPETSSVLGRIDAMISKNPEFLRPYEIPL